MNSKQVTLVLDASTPTLFLGLLIDDQALSTHVETLDRLQSEFMVPRILALLAKHDLSLADITEIVVGNGPGSFTGVRLALTFVKTLGVVQPLAIYPVSSLHLFAYGSSSIIWADARGGRMYIGIYEGVKILQEPKVMLQSDMTSIVSAFPFAIRRTPKEALMQPQMILDHVQAIKKQLLPLQDIHQLAPRYLKDLI